MLWKLHSIGENREHNLSSGGAGKGTDKMMASGFLVEVDAEIYLTTVEHLATRQTDDWALWDNELTLCSPTGEPVAKYPLFETAFFGQGLGL